MKKGKILSVLLALVMVVSLITPATAKAAESNNRVTKMVSEMSLRDKVTQMMMVDFRYWDEDLNDGVEKVGFEVMNDQIRKVVEDYNFGAFIYFAQNLTGTEQAYNLTMEMQAAATKDGGIPMLISCDQEGGNVYRLGTGTALPGNMALGAAGDVKYAEAAGKIIGSELAALGINTTLAPVVDVNNNANNPVIGLRSYGDDPTAVGTLASATIEGLAANNVIGCAKHFPGHGDTATDSHYGLPMVDKSLDVLKECELKPYEVAIEQGIEMIMTAHILYPQLESDKIVSNKTGEAESLPATMSDDILTGLLKEDMGFKGIIVTDAMNMAGIADKWDQVQAVVVAISAGVDMICMPCTLYDLEDLADLDAIINGVIAAVEDGTIPMERIDDAVTRILTVKENRGILDYNAADYTLEKALATVGSDENRETEREIAAAAVTVVKNENNVLPLDIKANSKVLMLVPYNNERSQMLMGWNRAEEAGLIPEGAEVDYFRFSKAAIADNAGLQEKLEWADTVIINSEISSTGSGRMKYGHWSSALPKAVTDYCAENGKISVISSVDKPYDVQLYPNADAILAAYGCKGSSVDPTEAIVGGTTGSKAAYGPNIIAAVEVALGVFGAQGKLPVNIQKYSAESNSYTDEIVYARGHGITYDALEAKYTPSDKVTVDVYEDMEAIVYDDGQGNTLPYRLYVPENYDSNKEYPVLVFLHGAGERGSDNTAQLLNAIQLLFYAQKEVKDAIVIAPQCPADKRWVETDWTLGCYDSEAIQEEQLAKVMGILEDVQETYSTNSDRIYALGLSMGGFGIWDLLTRHSDVFAAGVPICGSGDPNKAEILKDVPIWTFHGDADKVVPYTGTQTMYNAIVAAGGEQITFTTYPGAGHGIWNDAVITKGLGEWLFAQKLSDRQEVDKSAAQEYYDDCLAGYNKDEYTEESWAAFQEALEGLKAALEAEDITAEELQAAMDAVANNLPVKKTPAEDTNKPGEDTNKPGEDDKEDTKTPQTGDSSMIMVYVMMMAVCVFVLASKKKRV